MGLDIGGLFGEPPREAMIPPPDRAVKTPFYPAAVGIVCPGLDVILESRPGGEFGLVLPNGGKQDIDVCRQRLLGSGKRSHTAHQDRDLESTAWAIAADLMRHIRVGSLGDSGRCAHCEMDYVFR